MPTTHKYYIHDHLYSSVAEANYVGTVGERYEYDAYGKCYILEPNFAPDPDGKSDANNPFLFTGREMDTLDNGNLKIMNYRHRYYDTYTGRFTTHDPLGIVPNAQQLNRFDLIGQYKDGMNLYEYVQSSPTNRLDPSGLWRSGHHIGLTEKAFKTWVSGLPSTSKPDKKCDNKMLNILQTANLKQDNPFMPPVYEHHYTRKYIADETVADKIKADKDYETYLKSEKTEFNTALGLLTGCWKALEALGRMDHALQDFYGHAINRTGGFDPFEAWSTGTTGTPYQRSSFWPPSYRNSPKPPSGEHPYKEEPVNPGSAEGVARKNAAFSFMIDHYNKYLGKWWKDCKCVCCK